MFLPLRCMCDSSPPAAPSRAASYLHLLVSAYFARCFGIAVCCQVVSMRFSFKAHISQLLQQASNAPWKLAGVWMPSELWRDQVQPSEQEDCFGKSMWEGKPERGATQHGQEWRPSWQEYWPKNMELGERLEEKKIMPARKKKWEKPFSMFCARPLIGCWTHCN